jgi:hypothetical protein
MLENPGKNNALKTYRWQNFHARTLLQYVYPKNMRRRRELDEDRTQSVASVNTQMRFFSPLFNEAALTSVAYTTFPYRSTRDIWRPYIKASLVSLPPEQLIQLSSWYIYGRELITTKLG